MKAQKKTTAKKTATKKTATKKTTAKKTTAKKTAAKKATAKKSLGHSKLYSTRKREKPVKKSTSKKVLTPNELVKKHMPVVKQVVHGFMKHVPEHVSRSDLISEGYIGLIEAARKFDASKGIKFETYARPRIHGQMLDWLRSLDLLPRSARDKFKQIEAAKAALEKELCRTPVDSEISAYLNIPLETYQSSIFALTHNFCSIDNSSVNNSFSDAGNTSAYSKQNSLLDLLPTQKLDLDNKIFADTIWGLLKSQLYTCPSKEKLVISLLTMENLNLKEVGILMGYSPSTIRQTREKAFLFLAAHLANLRKVD